MALEVQRTSSFDNWQELLATPPHYDRSRVVDLGHSYSIDHLLPPDFCDDRAPTEMPTWLDIEYPGEIENRRLLLSAIPPDVNEFDIRAAAGRFGDIAMVEIDRNTRSALVQFFDIRAAAAMRGNGIRIHGQSVSVVFAPPETIKNRRKPPNNGTVVIFHLEPGTPDEAVREELSKYGVVRQVRSPPDRDTQRFVEFWDLRDAEAAIRGIKGKMLLNARVSVEFSLPGGYRKNLEVSEWRPPTVVRRNAQPLTMSF
jgi:hypothetical protein